MSCTRVASLFIVLMAAACGPRSHTPPPPKSTANPPAPFDALADSVVALWDEADLVCLGETHGSLLDAALREAVAAHPRFVDRVDVVVLEFASPLHQDLLDRLALDGEELSRDELRPIWRDAGLGAVWELPPYEEFLRAVAAANAARPRARRVRIVAAALPIDWSAVQRPDDLVDVPDRLAHFAAVLQHEVLEPERKGLAVFGRAHCERHPPGALGAAVRGAPSQARVVLAPDPTLGRARARRLLALSPSNPRTAQLVRVRGTFRADRPAGALFFMGHATAGLALGDVADAVAVYGQADTVLVPPWVGSDPDAEPPPGMPADVAAELARRDGLWQQAQRLKQGE